LKKNTQKTNKKQKKQTIMSNHIIDYLQPTNKSLNIILKTYVKFVECLKLDTVLFYNKLEVLNTFIQLIRHAELNLQKMHVSFTEDEKELFMNIINSIYTNFILLKRSCIGIKKYSQFINDMETEFIKINKIWKFIKLGVDFIIESTELYNNNKSFKDCLDGIINNMFKYINIGTREYVHSENIGVYIILLSDKNWKEYLIKLCNSKTQYYQRFFLLISNGMDHKIEFPETKINYLPNLYLYLTNKNFNFNSDQEEGNKKRIQNFVENIKRLS
jgi:hypothetical protein